ncbi:hypothetical protein HYX08_00135 [Candidatus Woesearchaeota archaeon]|nr:hypothetical protein [Candidatus Woesearchaeota archaeon]
MYYKFMKVVSCTIFVLFIIGCVSTNNTPNNLKKEEPIYKSNTKNIKEKVDIKLLSANYTTTKWSRTKFLGLRIKGIIKNKGKTNVKNIEFTANIFHQNNSFSLDCDSVIDIIKPNGTSPFICWSQDMPSWTNNLEEFSINEIKGEPTDIGIIDDFDIDYDIGTIEKVSGASYLLPVSVRIKNIGNKVIYKPQLFIILYDKEKKYLDYIGTDFQVGDCSKMEINEECIYNAHFQDYDEDYDLGQIGSVEVKAYSYRNKLLE